MDRQNTRWLMLAGLTLSLILKMGVRCEAAAGGLFVESIEKDMSASTAVVIGRLVRFVQKPPPRFPGGEGPWAKPPGTYTISVDSILKGDCPQTIDLESPQIEQPQYGTLNVRFETNGRFLLFLKKREPDAWVPADGQIPLIPISETAKMPTARPSEGDKEVLDVVTHLLLDSLSDPVARVTAMHLLQTIRSDAVVAAARAALDDPDTDMQQNALCCLAGNQIVEVIPQIAEVDRKVRQKPGIYLLLFAFGYYETEKATPYLNAVLLNRDSPVARTSAARALNQQRLANKSSIPALLEVLGDQEAPRDLVFDVDIILRRLLPELGPPVGRSLSPDDRGRDVRTARQWWADEQAGKHVNPMPERPTTSPSTQAL